MKLDVTRSNTALLALVRVALACAVLAPTMDVAAQTPSSTTIEPVADGTVRSIVPFGNDGTSQVLSVSAASIISLERSLVRFDQTAIASALQGKQLVSATLEFTVPTLATSWLGGRIGLHRMVQSWNEQGATWSCANDTNTGFFGDLFNNCSFSDRWGMDWLSWNPLPYEATSTDEAQVFASSGDTVTFDVSSDIAAYITGTSNHGWAIVGTQDLISGEWIQFGSRESASPGRLILTYVDPPSPPSTADTISLGVVATEDSFISELFPDWAREGSTRLKANSDQALFTKHALVQFRDGDIATQMAAAGVSGDYELESAHVVLTVKDRWPLLNVGQPIDIHRVVTPWEALGATWNCAVDTDPANIFANCGGATAWDMDAANPANRPYEPSATDSALAATNYGGEMLFDVAADVSTFLDGSTQNNGWLIRKPDQPWLGFISFFSIEGGVPPRLELTFRLRPCTVATPCEVAGPCLDDSECVAGLSCRTDVAWRFDAAQGFGVCWDDVPCGDEDHPDYNCGSLTDRCGFCPQCEFCSECPCEVGDPCDPTDAFCAPFLECRDGQCWDPICDDLSSEVFECGTEDALCGPTCPQCSPSCDGLACGYDGCIGRCGDAICDDGERGCESHADCADGLACIPEPDGVGTCRPEHCDHPGLNPCASVENAGTVTECGECPVCVPSCAGRSCGDDGCGGSCGSTPTGGFCTNDGQSASLIPLAFDTWAGDAGWLEDPFPYDGETVPGTVPGQLSVTDFGQAAYSIPIAVPPGRNGIQPNLSLNYNSSSGDGYLGIGWGLSGLSAIQRCAKTIAQDGAPAPITYTDSDRFCLDGRRLVLEDPSQTYGADGTWYRTEQETFSRILLYNPDEHGPSGFIEWKKDGTLRTFDKKVGGATAIGETSLHPPNYAPDASSEPIVAQTWALTMVEDRLGNSMTVDYWDPLHCPISQLDTCTSEGGTVREYYPLRISYTGYQYKGASRFVNFKYRPRTDLLAGYLRGARFERSYVLDQINSIDLSRWDGGRKIYQYNLAYNDAAGIGGRTTLASVTQCARRGLKPSQNGLTCKPPTSFEYESTSAAFEAKRTVPALPDVENTDRDFVGGPLVLDLDGNGQDDILSSECTAKENGECVAVSWKLQLNGQDVGDNMYAERTRMVVKGPIPYEAQSSKGRTTTKWRDVYVPAALYVFDYNMDGRDEVLEIDEKFWKGSGDGKVRVWGIYGGKLDVKTTSLKLNDAAVKKLFLLDVDGDGRADILTCRPRRRSGRRAGQTLDNEWSVRLGRRASFASRSIIAETGPPCVDGSPVDLTGDGKQELFLNTDYLRPVKRGGHKSSNQVVGHIEEKSSGVFYPYSGTYVANVIAARELDTVRVLGDVNGDGLIDAVDFSSDQKTEFWLNTGAGFVSQGRTSLPTSDFPGLDELWGRFLAYDVNRDGRTDFIYRSTGGEWKALLSNGKAFKEGTLPSNLSSVPRFEMFTLDVDHDGLRDLRGNTSAWVKAGPSRPLLHSATNGLGARTQVYYASLNQSAYASGDAHPAGLPEALDPAEYLPAPYISHTNQEDCPYPCYPRHPTGNVVRSIGLWDEVADAGNEPVRYQVYGYGGAARDLEGRGALGFALKFWVDSAQLARAQAAGATTKPFKMRRFDNLYYDALTRQYPKVGRANVTIAVVGMDPNTARTDVVNIEQFLSRPTPTSTHVYAAKISRRVTEGNTILNTVTKTLHDLDGNPLFAETTWNDSFDLNSTDFSLTTIQYVDQSISPDNNWLTGVPKLVTQYSQRGSGVGTQRVTEYQYNSSSRVLPTDIYEGLDTQDRLHTAIAYDKYGNPIETVVSGMTLDGLTTRTTQVTYDDEGIFPSRVTNAAGHVVEYKYDRGLGVPLRTIADGKPGKKTTTLSIPDGFGRPRRLIDRAGNLTRIDYTTPFGALQVRTDRDGEPIRTATFDVLGRTVSEAVRDFDASTAAGSPSGLLYASREYNAMGLLARTNGFYDPQDGGVRQDTLYTYDPLGRMLRAELPDGTTVESCYKENVTCTRNPLGYSHCQVNNEHGQLAHSIQPSSSDQRTCQEVLLEVWRDFPAESEPLGFSIFDGNSYEYGDFDQLVRVHDPLQSPIEFVYDTFGRVIESTDPNAGTSFSRYDVFGNLESTESATGDTTEYRYDGLARMLSKTERLASAAPGDELVTSYIHDEFFGEGFTGELILSGDDDGAVQINTFDDAGRPIRFAREVPTSSEFGSLAREMTYDSAGRLSLVSYDSVNGTGEPLAYRHHYNADGYLSSIQLADPETPNDASADKMLWEISATDAYGRVALESFANGQQTTREYWANTGLLRRQSTQAGSVFAQDWRYEYDANQNVIERIDGRSAAEETTQYAYDHLGRLSSADSFAGLPGGGGASTHLEAYTYDLLGNIKSRGVTDATTGTSTSWTYNYETGDSRRLLSVTDGTVDSSFEYDAAGRMQKRTGNLQTPLELLYNAQGMPTAMGQALDTSAGLAGATTIGYDAFGTRIRKSSPDGETLYLDDAFRRVSSASASGLEEHLTISGGGHAVAEIIRDTIGTDHVQYLHTDVLGSVDAVTDESGAVVEERRHEAFGKIRSTSGGAPYGVKPSFTGHEFDSEHGLVNMKARLYDPEIGRFLTPDPLLADPSQIQGINPYSYVNNNPLRFVDPSGMQSNEYIPNGGYGGSGCLGICLTTGETATDWETIVDAGESIGEGIVWLGENIGKGAVALGEGIGDLFSSLFSGASDARPGPPPSQQLPAKTFDASSATSGPVGATTPVGGRQGGMPAQLPWDAVFDAQPGGFKDYEERSHQLLTAPFELFPSLLDAPAVLAMWGGLKVIGAQGLKQAVMRGASRGLWKITKEGTERAAQWGKRTISKHRSTGLWWSKDTAGHGGSVWKVFKEEAGGLRHFRDADKYGDFIVGKHKGPVGEFIPWKLLGGK